MTHLVIYRKVERYYYNPVVGGFLQEDTYRGDGLNLYAYCANNPVMYYDPGGHIMEKVFSTCNGGTKAEELEETGAASVADKDISSSKPLKEMTDAELQQLGYKRHS